MGGGPSWSLAAILGYFAVWLSVVVYSRYQLSPYRILDEDETFHLALIGELRHHFPPAYPQMDAGSLAYQWFVHAHMAASTWVTGIDPLLVYRRLDVLVLGAMCILGTAAVATRLAGRPWVGVLAATILVLVGSFDISGVVQGQAAPGRALPRRRTAAEQSHADDGLRVGDAPGSVDNSLARGGDARASDADLDRAWPRSPCRDQGHVHTDVHVRLPRRGRRPCVAVQTPAPSRPAWGCNVRCRDCAERDHPLCRRQPKPSICPGGHLDPAHAVFGLERAERVGSGAGRLSPFSAVGSSTVSESWGSRSTPTSARMRVSGSLPGVQQQASVRRFCSATVG